MQIPDSEIDFSDIPELTDEQLRGMRRGRPPIGESAKIPISFRIDVGLLTRIRELADAEGRPYQTVMHELLEAAARRRR